MNDTELRFKDGFDQLQRAISDNAIRHGFYEEEATRYFKCGNDGEFVQVDLSKTFQAKRIALQHSELSEGLESIRNPDPSKSKMDEHCPGFTSLEVELADTVIRIMDMSEFYKLRLSEAIIAKHNFNIGRPLKHGKAF